MNEFNSSTSSFGTDDCYALAAKTRKSTNDERARTVSNARVVVRVRASVASRANVESGRVARACAGRTRGNANRGNANR